MADEIDLAQDMIERTTDSAILAARNYKPEAEYTGFCLNCGDETRHGQRWCDRTCQWDWEGWVKRKGGT